MNLEIVNSVLAGERGPRRDIVLVNAAADFWRVAIFSVILWGQFGRFPQSSGLPYQSAFDSRTSVQFNAYAH